MTDNNQSSGKQKAASRRSKKSVKRASKEQTSVKKATLQQDESNKQVVDVDEEATTLEVEVKIESDPPQSLKSLVAQTDASGVAQYDTAPDEAASSDSRGVVGSQQSRNPSLLMSLMSALCCCCHSPESRTDTSRSSASRGKVPNRSMGGSPLLPQQLERSTGQKCLVLDLDETLVHSSFKPVPNPDYIIPVEIEGVVHHVYVLKRPGVDEFFKRIKDKYEVVVYTASLAKYANPLLDQLDMEGVIDFRLFREACTNHEGNYVKDLSLLGRELSQTIIVDNSPASFMFHPEHAIGISSFIDDMTDRELYLCADFLDKIVDVENVVDHMYTYQSYISGV